jgi:hypothetical protein
MRSEPASQEYPEGLACQEQSCAPSRGLHKKHQHLLPVAPAVIPLAVELQIFDMPFFSEGNKLQESGFHEVLLVTFKLSILMTNKRTVPGELSTLLSLSPEHLG